MKLSVIIVSYNVRCYLQQCLDSLQRALDGVDAERSGQPRSHVVNAFVVDIERTLVRINLPAVVELVVQSQIALKLIGTAAQRQVVLLQNLLLYTKELGLYAPFLFFVK